MRAVSLLTVLGDVAPMGTHAWSLIEGEVREYSQPVESMQTINDASFEVFLAAEGHHTGSGQRRS